MDWTWYVALIGGYVVVVRVFLMHANPLHRAVVAARRQRFLDRGEMDLAEWYETYWAPQGLSFSACLTLVGFHAEALGCHLTNFRPGDGRDEFALVESFVFGLPFDDEMEDLESALHWWRRERESGMDRRTKRRVAKQFRDVHNLGDLIRCYEVYFEEASKKSTVDHEI
jgi:hypothetical protein